MTYRVHFHRIIRDRKRGTYTAEFPSDHCVTVSDYTVAKHGDFVDAAFARRPDLLGNVSAYRVTELRQQGGKLIATLFMLGNDHPGCRQFYKPTI